MESTKTVTVETTVALPVAKVWKLWTKPEHITQWNFAAESWHCPAVENNLQPGGSFSYTMEAKDGSMGFDFSGQYDQVIPLEQIAYTLGDGRKVTIAFTELSSSTKISETFEVEDANTAEQQKAGWQAILDNFRKYAEAQD